jgi:hypothetical protein
MPEELGERQRHEQALMRIGRRLQSIGQLLDQAPAHIMAKGFTADDAVTGGKPVQIDLDEMRAIFDPASPKNVGSLLQEYHELLLRLRKEGG